MKFKINFIPNDQEEELSFSIHQMTPLISDTIEMFKHNNNISSASNAKQPLFILGKIQDTFYKINIKDIYYLESVDRKVFLYTERKSYEVSEKLYILEEMLSTSNFVRISKSTLLNINKIYSFSPVLSGNLEALLLNKEKVVISRRYVSNMKKQLGMGDNSL